MIVSLKDIAEGASLIQTEDSTLAREAAESLQKITLEHRAEGFSNLVLALRLSKMFGTSFRTLPIPLVSHTSIIERCGRRKKPFGEKKGDKGYKDYLIWLSIVELTKTADLQIIFLSQNKNDFADETGTVLHADLLIDLDESLAGKLSYFKGLREFNSRFAMSDEDWKDKLSSTITKERFEFETATKDNIFLLTTQLDALEFSLEKASKGYSAQALFNPLSILDILNVIKIDHDKILVTTECLVGFIANEAYENDSGQKMHSGPTQKAFKLRVDFTYDHHEQVVVAAEVIEAYELNCFEIICEVLQSTETGPVVVAARTLNNGQTWVRTFDDVNEFGLCSSELSLRSNAQLEVGKQVVGNAKVVTTEILKKWGFS
jgi:hypothetical protein